MGKWHTVKVDVWHVLFCIEQILYAAIPNKLLWYGILTQISEHWVQFRSLQHKQEVVYNVIQRLSEPTLNRTMAVI